MERLREFKVKTVGEKELRRTMLKHMDRGLQILEFCKENEISVDDIIVIDDDSGDIVDHIPAPNFIHTFFENGLTFLDVHRFLLSLNYKIFKHE